MPPVIEISRLTKEYVTDGKVVTPVLKGLNFQIQEGECVSVMGPSGSGKSTLMNILGCLDVPTHGDYRLHGQSVSGLDADNLADLRNRVLGFVFQSFYLLPRKSARENIELPLMYAGQPLEKQRTVSEVMLRKMGISQLANSKPNQMSGGQQQRVAIARALANSPKVILADEPTGNLDSETSREMMQLLTSLNKQEGMTLIIVTHDPTIAAYTDRLLHLVDGVISYDGPPAGIKEQAP